MTGRTFAIDYDGTWTADPEAFRAIATMLRRRGHRVLLVTARVSGHGEVERETAQHVDRVLFCGAEYKREHCAAVGESVDVWVDDMPGMIGPRDHAVSTIPTLARARPNP